jgi:hypothetical protein
MSWGWVGAPAIAATPIAEICVVSLLVLALSWAGARRAQIAKRYASALKGRECVSHSETATALTRYVGAKQ